MSAHEQLGACPEHFEIMRSALDHIIKTARASRTSTRRIRWIEKRAQMALDGRPYSDAQTELPKYNLDSQERKTRRALCRIHILKDALTALVCDAAAVAKSDTKLYATWLTAREAIGAAGDEDGAIETLAASSKLGAIAPDLRATLDGIAKIGAEDGLSADEYQQRLMSAVGRARNAIGGAA